MAPRLHFGRRSVRLRLLVLLLVPLLSLAALWAFAAYLTSQDALGKYEASTTYDKVALPASALTATLEQERTSAAVLIGSGRRQGREGVVAARSATDAAQGALRRAVLSGTARGAMSAQTKQRLDALLTQLDGLPGIRAQIDAGSLDALTAVNDYNGVVDSLLHLFSSLSQVNDVGIYQQGAAIIGVSIGHDFLMREDALMTAALASPQHRFTEPEFTAFAQNAYAGRYEFDSGLADMKASMRGPLDQLAGSSGFNTVRSLEDAIIAAGPHASLTPTAEQWRTTVTPLLPEWIQATNEAGVVLTAEAKPIGDRIMFTLYAATGFGLLAVVLSILVSVLYGRSLARELITLQGTALEVARERLPRVIKRLRAGENVDLDAEAPPIEVGRTKEVAKVADALTTLERTAIEASINEARLRGGVNKVFLNLAWRNQSLLHRQLTMLDSMERQASDPDALEDLFALDHLTTRMRRHAEGLVILSGSVPARGWHNPVAVRDILRGAIAEVEDYTRVVVDAASPAALDGSVVADITHLLAELIENATAFSPPPTQVHVRGELTATGYVVEIEDRGIGMDDDELADANVRLANPPEFDVADSDRLGLFIVGRLAERHGIDVRIGPSPYGGVLSVVAIPLDFIAGDNGSDYEHTWADEQTANPIRRRDVLGWGRPPRIESSPAAEPAPELPRRIRQQSLAPQLRRDTPAPGPIAAGPTTTRPPEETRSLMSSLQQGWERGRAEQDPDE
jgi:signal transduction histidine kinase